MVYRLKTLPCKPERHLAHCFVLFWGFGDTFRVFSYFRCKIDVIFLFGDPDFLQRQRNFAPISLNFRDMTRTDRETTDNIRQTRRPTQKALIHLYTVNRFFMKLFRTSDISVVHYCQSLFAFDLPIVLH